ncbi:nudix hydrolase 15, mitochondrial-like protein [Cinnamomum micranthum f. kanehirae]|uniref:Nudix hydrolase 15, mitochondrial-like protein n=1 Tax=Cinnamomum micranthum f. kanehirae TaxID=337451 RepID=A0A3S3MJT7_9MAGN|nr:nudix hydrolase 15, mitochondrial-like protein [Cinnamomum micranthum f. kanehirae]
MAQIVLPYTLQSLAHQLQSYKPPNPPCLMDKEEEQEQRSLGFEPIHQKRERRAAVLICLFEGEEGNLRVILTKRSKNLSTHSGEVALPGGKREEGDVDDSATALREAMEEIGLDPSLICVVAVLEPFISQHLLEVVPVVGLLAQRAVFKPLLNTAEVDCIFDVPLEMFLKEENHTIEEREWMDWKFVIHLFEFKSEQENFIICGLTARILIRVASIIYQRPPPFKQHLPDFQRLQASFINPNSLCNINSTGEETCGK